MTAAALTRTPIDPAALIAAVVDESHGATALFLGTVRNTNAGRPVARLEYTAYDAMAGREILAIVGEAEARFAGCRIAAVHRLGALDLGDVAVGIAVGHAHRTPAFEACRHVLEEIKRRVPIWKREHYSDGTAEWVAAATPAGGAPSP